MTVHHQLLVAVQNLLKFKETMDTVVLEAFRGKEEFEHTLKVGNPGTPLALLRIFWFFGGRERGYIKRGTLISETFSLVTNVQSAFEEFIDKRRNKPAELVAKFLDRKLRSRKKDMTDEELDHLMDKLMVIFRFIQGLHFEECFAPSWYSLRLESALSRDDFLVTGCLGYIFFCYRVGQWMLTYHFLSFASHFL